MNGRIKILSSTYIKTLTVLSDSGYMSLRVSKRTKTNIYYIYALNPGYILKFMRFFLIVAGALFFLGACVPNRKYVYLQKDDVNKKDLPTDTVLREYNLHFDEYRIQPLDLLFIRVESITPEDYDFINRLDPSPDNLAGSSSNIGLTRGYLVDTNGEVEYPVLGKVLVNGLTVFEAQDKLAKAFEQYLTMPVVRVRLLNFRFTILGEVSGEKQVVSTNTRVTFMEAIGLAGGLTELADRSKVKVLRQVGDKTEVFYVNLLEEEFVTSNKYYVQQNDIIIVPSLRQRPFRRYFGSNMALFVSTVSTVLLVINLLK